MVEKWATPLLRLGSADKTPVGQPWRRRPEILALVAVAGIDGNQLQIL